MRNGTRVELPPLMSRDLEFAAPGRRRYRLAGDERNLFLPPLRKPPPKASPPGNYRSQLELQEARKKLLGAELAVLKVPPAEDWRANPELNGYPEFEEKEQTAPTPDTPASSEGRKKSNRRNNRKKSDLG